MKAVGKIMGRKDLAYKFGQTEHHMKGTGAIINRMVRGSLCTQMGMYMMAVGKMGRPMVMAFSFIT